MQNTTGHTIFYKTSVPPRSVVGLLSSILLLTLLLFPARVLAAEPQAPDMEPVRIFMQWEPQSQFAGFIMARKKGFFQKRGLAVKFIWAKLGDRPLQAMANGDADFAGAWLSMALDQRAQGYPVINILQLHQRSASLIVARTETRKPADLNGKILLSWGGDFSVEFNAFLRINKIRPAKVLPLSTSMAPFLYGLVSATQSMEYNEIFRLIERGMTPSELTVFRLSDYGVNLVADGLYTCEDYLADKPHVVRAVREAVLEGWEYALAHKDETIDTVMGYAEVKNLRSNASHQRKMLDLIGEIITCKGWDSPPTRGMLFEEDFNHAVAILRAADIPLPGINYQQFSWRP